VGQPSRKHEPNDLSSQGRRPQSRIGARRQYGRHPAQRVGAQRAGIDIGGCEQPQCGVAALVDDADEQVARGYRAVVAVPSERGFE